MAHGVGTSGSGVGRKAWEERLVGDHLHLVRMAVNAMAARVPRHVPRDELESAAMTGLAQAARSFDPARDTRFEQYAAARIKGALLDELRSRDWASRSVRSLWRQVNEAQDGLAARLGRLPTADEVAASAGVDIERLRSLAHDVHRSVVLNYESLIPDADAADVLSDGRHTCEEAVLRRERYEHLHDAIAALPERLRTVVVGYFFEERQMQEIADELEVTPSRVSQMRTEALTLLRDGLAPHLDGQRVVVDLVRTARSDRRRLAYVAAIGERTRVRRQTRRPAGLAASA